jgi:hypothetical protein
MEVIPKTKLLLTVPNQRSLKYQCLDSKGTCNMLSDKINDDSIEKSVYTEQCRLNYGKPQTCCDPYQKGAIINYQNEKINIWGEKDAAKDNYQQCPGDIDGQCLGDPQVRLKNGLPANYEDCLAQVCNIYGYSQKLNQYEHCRANGVPKCIDMSNKCDEAHILADEIIPQQNHIVELNVDLSKLTLWESIRLLRNVWSAEGFFNMLSVYFQMWGFYICVIFIISLIFISFIIACMYLIYKGIRYIIERYSV